MNCETLIKIKDLFVEYHTNKGILGGKKTIHAVNGVSLDIHKGEILALAGESGCGKSTIAKAILRLEPSKSGEVLINGKNILSLNKKDLKEFRKHAQMVFQNPYASLNPKMKIIDILKEPLEINTDYSKKKIEEIIKEKIATIGEKINFRRFVRYEGNTASYIHNGKIGVLIQTDKKDDELMNDICLHIASSAPEFITRDEIPQSVIDHETEVEMGKEDLLKKPEQIRAKIVEGRVNKLLSHRVLLEQPFVKNPDMTVGQLIEGKMTIKAFTRYMLGEGLEKRQENFADEVMSQIKG